MSQLVLLGPFALKKHFECVVVGAKLNFPEQSCFGHLYSAQYIRRKRMSGFLRDALMLSPLLGPRTA